MRTYPRLTLPLLLFGLAAGAPAQNPPEHTGEVSQPLVGGTLVDLQTQRDFGLLVLTNPAGSCSASMLNDSWAITAAHCVYPSTTAASAAFAPAQIQLTANWLSQNKTHAVLQVIPFTGFPFQGNNDIALLQVGARDFNRTLIKDRTLARPDNLNTLNLLLFGRGISQLAFQSPAGPVPAVRDGQYRSARLLSGVVSRAGETPSASVDLPLANGVAVAGGDSGGPMYFQAWDSPNTNTQKLEWRLLGIHSNCSVQCLAGQSCTPPANPWTFVSAINSCQDASVLPVRDRILNIIATVSPDNANQPGSFGTAVPPSVLAHRRALYATNIDEPLVAPPGAAVDVQLPFQNCHGLAHVGPSPCILSPAFQQWGYDSATHRLLHVDSGKCVNISGAHREPGAWIILFPCSGAPNEKWTVMAQQGGSILSFRSDLSGLCLSAIPGKNSTGGRGPALTIATSGRLTQMPCNGADPAQRFADADSAWASRNGPR